MMARRLGGDDAAVDLRRGAGGDLDSLGRGSACRRAPACCRRVRSARRTTRSRTSRSSAAVRNPRPGEISLAHHGVLFLDEMPEFSRHVLEVLRQPIEEGCVRIARAARTVTFPRAVHAGRRDESMPLRISSATPVRVCRCTPQQIARYGSRLSGPLRDRLDLTVPVAAMPARELADAAGGEPSAAIRERVVAARARQMQRDGGLNCRLHGRSLKRATALADGARRMFAGALTRLSLTARGHDRVLRVARTIADLASADPIGVDHVAEALQFRGEG